MPPRGRGRGEGGFQTRPYVGRFVLDDYHAMNVVRHQDERVERNVLVVIRDPCPGILYDRPESIRRHPAIDDLTKCRTAILSTHCDEICAWG